MTEITLTPCIDIRKIFLLLLLFSKRDGFPWSLLLQRCLCIKLNWLAWPKRANDRPLPNKTFTWQSSGGQKKPVPGIFAKSGKCLAGLSLYVQVALLQAGWSRFEARWSQRRQRQWWRWRRDEHQDASNVRAWGTRSGEQDQHHMFKIRKQKKWLFLRILATICGCFKAFFENINLKKCLFWYF